MAQRKQTVLITGCSPGGIGNNLAREFHAKGYHVLATARDRSHLKDLEELGITTLDLTVDQPASVAALKDEVSKITGGKLDYLVNNAGRNYTVPALHIEREEVEYTFRTNVFGVMDMCQTFTPLLIASQGTIVQIGSVAGIIPYVFGSVYNASKAALHSYTNTLRVELAPFNVKVITIVTGGVRSNIARTDRDLPPDSLYNPIREEYLRRVKHSQAVGVDTAVYVWAGAQARAIWWLTSFLPLSLFDRIFTHIFHLYKLRGTSQARQKAD